MLSALAFVLGGALLLQQSSAEVHASLSDDRIAVGASTMLQVTIEASSGRPEQVDVPSLPPSLDVISSREYLQTQLSLPGGRTTVIRRDIVLRARSEGSFTIPPVVVHLRDGTVRRTRPLRLRVVAGAPGAPGASSAAPFGTTVGAGNLQVVITPDTAWLGEPVLMRMTALIPEEQRTRRGRAPSFEPPAAPGFWVQEVEDRGVVGVRALGAQYYDVHEYRRLYVPLTAGEHELSPGRAVYEVDRGWMFAPQTYELTSDPVPLVVRALPTAGRPASFTGAVGSFDARASVTPAALGAGDAATLTVEVEGTGHIKALPAPRLPAMDGIEVFPATEDATFTARTSGMHGSKRFQWMLIPERSGTLELPPIEYTWFDPETAAYETARVELPTLTVQGTMADATPEDTALAPLRTAPHPVPAYAWAGSTWFALLQLAPLVLLAGSLIWRRQAPRLQRRRAVRRGRDEGFARARARASLDPRGALSDLEHALDAAVAALAGGRGTDADALRARGVGDNVLVSLAAVRSAIRGMRFRPEPVSARDAESLIERAALITRRIERALRARRAVAATALVPLLLLAPGAVAQEGGTFAEAVAAFERAEYDDARAGFVAHLGASPLDAAAWYNLGNADFRRGARGAAVHAWARALRLQPRADDARHNLAAVDATAAIAAARQPVPLTANELRALAGVAWLLGATLVAFGIPGRVRTARLTRSAGVTAVVVAAAALLALAGHRTWPHSAVAVHAAAVRAGPVLRAEQRASLEAGEVARIVAWQAEWVHVRTSTVEGWVEARDLGRIQP